MLEKKSCRECGASVERFLILPDGLRGGNGMLVPVSDAGQGRLYLPEEDLPLAILAGVPHEIGRQIGVLMQSDLQRSLPGSETEGPRNVPAWLKRNAIFSPDQREEFAGLAEAAGIPVQSLVDRNLEMEIHGPGRMLSCSLVLPLGSAFPSLVLHGYSSLGGSAESSAPPMALDPFVAWTHYQGKIPFLGLCWAPGLQGIWSGVNACGLAAALSHHSAPVDVDGRFVPVSLLVRNVLGTAGTLDEAEAVLRASYRAGAWTILLSHGDSGEVRAFTQLPTGAVECVRGGDAVRERAPEFDEPLTGAPECPGKDSDSRGSFLRPTVSSTDADAGVLSCHGMMDLFPAPFDGFSGIRFPVFGVAAGKGRPAIWTRRDPRKHGGLCINVSQECVERAAPGSPRKAGRFAVLSTRNQDGDQPPTPMIGGVVRMVPVIEAQRELHLQEDLYLSEHRIHQDPVLPGSFGIEMMGELASLSAGSPIAGMEGVRIHRALKVLSGESLLVKAVLHPASGGSRVRIRLLTDFHHPDGRLIEENREHYSCEVDVQACLPPKPRIPDPMLRLARQGGFSMDGFYRMSRNLIISVGPMFHSMRWMRVPSKRSAIGCLQFLPENGLFASTPRPHTLFSPLFLDGMFQIPAVLASYTEGSYGVPDGLGRLTFYRKPEVGERCYSFTVLGEPRDSVVLAQAVVTDTEGETVAVLEDFAVRLAFPMEASIRNEFRKIFDRRLPPAADNRQGLPGSAGGDVERKAATERSEAPDPDSRGTVSPPTAGIRRPEKMATRRYRLETVPLCLPERGLFGFSCSKRRLLLIADQGAVHEHLAAGLRSRGGEGVVVHPVDDATGSGLLLLDRDRPEQIGEVIRSLEESGGEFSGFIDLSGLVPPRPGPGPMHPGFAREMFRHVLLLFHLSRYFYRRFQSSGPGNSCCFTATSVGTVYGGGELNNLHLSGLSGFVKGVRVECPMAVAKAVDFQDLGDPGWVSERILDELAVGDLRTEVWYRGGVRFGARAVEVSDPEFTRADLRIQPDCVVLVTGGGTGVTFECALAIAEQVGCTVVACGRTPMPTGDEDWIRMSEEERVAFQPSFLRGFRKQNPGSSPKQALQAFQRLNRARELYRNLGRARARRLKFHYDACDVGDRDQVTSWLSRVRERFGRIDGVVHGAMVEESKSLDRKSEGVVRATLSAKVLGLVHLVEETRGDGLKVFLNFGSGAGVFGNKGQQDYAAANATMARTAIALARAGGDGCRFLTLDWPGWLGAGSLERYDSAIMKQLKEMQATFIHLDEGAYRLLQALRYQEEEHEILLCGEPMLAGSPLGALSDGLGVNRRWSDDDGKPLLECQFPLVDRIVPPGAADPFTRVWAKLPAGLARSALQTPGACAALGLEILAEAVAVSNPRQDIRSVEDFALEQGADPESVPGWEVRITPGSPGSGCKEFIAQAVRSTAEGSGGSVVCRARFRMRPPSLLPSRVPASARVPEGEQRTVCEGIPDHGLWQFSLPALCACLDAAGSVPGSAPRGAFCSIPLLERGDAAPTGRVVILAPTREGGIVCTSDQGVKLFVLTGVSWHTGDDREPLFASGAKGTPECGRPEGSSSDAGPSHRQGGASPASQGIVRNRDSGDRPLDMAIVGMACYFSQIPDLDAFFTRIRNGGTGLQEVPADRWNWKEYAGAGALGPERIRVHIGHFVPKDVPLSWRDFRILPKDLPTINAAERMLLEVTRSAIQDAKLTAETPDRDRTAVIVGANGVGTEKWGATVRNRLDEILAAFRSTSDYQALDRKKRDRIAKSLLLDLLQYVGDLERSGAPEGALSVSISRVMSLFDLKGPHFVVDAGCASSLAALDLAVQGIRLGEYRRAVVSAVSPLITPYALAAYGSIGMGDGPSFLSTTGVFPFEQRADGTVFGEGATSIVLRPLQEARDDGDRIYAVLKGCAGRAGGSRGALLSFHSNGLDQAATLALEQAGFSPETIDYHECHGNGIPVSDHAEIEALDRVYGPALKQARRSLPLGSVKNQIGYLMAASGLAGVIKAALCIRHRIIPAQHGFTSPHPDLRLEERPLHIPRVEQTLSTTLNRPMRASVSSIGFGGMFYHAILEGEEEKRAGTLCRKTGPGSTPPAAFQPVAIVGMAGIFPGARSVGELWSNTLKRDCCVGPVPRDRLDPDLHVDKTRARIWRSYTDLGTVIDPYPVPRPAKGMWPTQIQAMNPTQVLTIHCVEEALRDAGIGPGDWDPQRVVFAVGEIHNRMREIESRVRVEIGGMLSYLMTSFGLKGLSEDRRRECLRELGKILSERYPKVDADHLFGYLSCVNTGRIAHRHNIQGFHLTTETVCSSSLTALTVCLQALQLHRCDLAIAGGVWANLTPEFYAQLCYLNAVSQHGVFPFDRRADGVVPGEGGGMVVVKRLDDAVKAGDRIHAVILGMGSSSDGRFKTILAPNPDAQVLAIRRAFSSAGIDPATVDFVECHGASTKGDLVEIDSLKRGYGENGGQPLYLGSVKANVGHLNAAAGVASVIKTTLALAHKTIPPMAQFETPHPDADFGRLTIPLEPLPWNRTNGPRRAGLNSLGMMGHNYHLLLEEWPG